MTDNKLKDKTIILAGSGHAHLEIIKALSKKEISKHRFLLISPERNTFYSGLIPRFIAGEIDATKLTINSAEFAEQKGIQFIQDSICSIDKTDNSITLKSGNKEFFDILSINIGGTTKLIDSESKFNTVYLRPFNEFLTSWNEVIHTFAKSSSPRFVVVGGGAAAVEVATALQRRINTNQLLKSEIHLVTQSSRLCEGYSNKISDLILQSILKFGIQVHFNESVNKIFEKHLQLSSGIKLEFDSIFIATPTSPGDFISEKVDSTLRLAPNIFAVGDCTGMKSFPQLPRSGVIAVHQGRHLANNIRAVLKGEIPAQFIPRNQILNILISGNKSARLIWGQQSFEGALALKIKNWIDERYMKSFE